MPETAIRISCVQSFHSISETPEDIRFISVSADGVPFAVALHSETAQVPVAATEADERLSGMNHFLRRRNGSFAIQTPDVACRPRVFHQN